MYTEAPTLDELAKAIEGYRFGVERTHVPPDPQIPLEAPTGIEPVASSGHALEPNLLAWVERQAAEAVRLYLPRFDVGDAL
jgi:hypothetical protein